MLAEWNKPLKMDLADALGKNVFTGQITGLSHYEFRNIYHRILPATPIRCVADPDNPYDKNNAVAIQVFVNKKWRQVGWIPKGMNMPAASAMAKGWALHASIEKYAHRQDLYTSKFEINVFISFHQPALSDADYKAKLNAAQFQPLTPAALAAQSEIKETTMSSTVNKIVANNVNLGTSAAFLEAGRIANGQITKVAAKNLPLMVRGYADTALGQLVLANIAKLAQEHFRPNDDKLQKLTNAMVVSAYQTVLQQFDIEEMIDDMLSNATIKKALKSVETADA